METFFRKKHFLEIYIPIGIAIGPFIILATGMSLFWGMVAGVLAAMMGRLIYLKKNPQ